MMSKPVEKDRVMESGQSKMPIKTGLLVLAKSQDEMNGIPGKHVGTVDHFDGDTYIKLNRELFPNQHHRWIPIDWVERVDGNAIYLNKTEQDFRSQVFNCFPGDFL